MTAILMKRLSRGIVVNFAAQISENYSDKILTLRELNLNL
jgi:hypothetical protein